MRWLIWLAYRQSQAAFVYLGLAFALMVGVQVAHYKIAGLAVGAFDLFLLLGLGTTVGLVFCSSVFFRDQQNNAAAMLTHRGIAPGKVWWSRILTFGLSYAIYCVPLTVLYLTTAKCNDLYFHFFISVEGYGEWHRDGWWLTLYVAITLFAAIFCIGQMISLFIRSFIAAIPVVAGLFCGLFFWVMIVKYLLGYGGLVWAVWPVLIACLVASRIRTANWQRGRNTWRAWRPPVLALAIPMLVILCVIPIVRVYSVPVIYLGYPVNYEVLHTRFVEDGYVMLDMPVSTNDALQRREALRQFNIKTAYLITDDNPVLPIPKYEAWRIIGECRNNSGFTLDTIKLLVRCYGYYQGQYYHWELQRFAESKNMTPETLRELVAFLETESQNRPLLRSVVVDAYEEEYRLAANYHFALEWWLRYGLPGERHRIMRRLNYEYQVQSQLADEIEQVIYYNQGSFVPVEGKAEILRTNRTSQYREIFQEQSALIGNYYWDTPTNPHDILHKETRKRALILQLALQAYSLEHGELPETLAELEGDYVTQLPSVPITGAAFEYQPHPAADELVGFVYDDNNSSNAYRGVPYLRVPIDATRRNNMPHSGNVYHLEFMKKPKPEDVQEPEPEA